MRPIAVAVTTALIASPVLAEVGPAQPHEFIEAFQGLFGEHKGVRKGHAKGVCAVGEFTASSEAASAFDAPLFSGRALPAQLRFSMAGGNPKVADFVRSPRGLAAQFTLPDGSLHNIATLSTPVFGARNPESFLGLLRASLPGADGKTDTAKLEAFRRAHPDTRPQAEWLAANPPPWSYATARYFGLHTFYLTGRGGAPVKIRWHLQPRDGVKGLTDEEMSRRQSDFLEQRLKERLAQGPLRFDWIVSLGTAEDSDDDPSVSWPEERRTIRAGTLSITGVGGDGCGNLNFDPNVLSEGFAASQDPILRMRSPAYAISFGKRLSGQ